MRTDKYFVKLAICCQVLLALYACENSDGIEDGTTCNVVIARTQGEGETDPLTSLSYTLCIFRAAVAVDGEENPAKYICIEHKSGLTKDEVDSYSFKIDNHNIGDYEYRLFIHATPKINGKTETTVLNIKEESSYDDIEIGMVMEEDGSYIPLSRDNYYATTNLTMKEMINGATTVKLSLKRLVGQLVFDFFKSTELGNPIDIDTDYLSTLDRVSHIKVQVQGITSKIKLAGMVATEDAEKQISHQFETILENDYRLDVKNQNKVNIVAVDKDKATPLGGARVFSVYLLPTVNAHEKDVEKSKLKADLTFKYYDTPQNDGSPIEKELNLKLPSTQNGVLTVKENCYTLTNVRLKNNRIIDLNASGDMSINTEWDEWDNKINEK